MEGLQSWRGLLEQREQSLMLEPGRMLEPGEWAAFNASIQTPGVQARVTTTGKTIALSILGPFELQQPSVSADFAASRQGLRLVLEESGLTVLPINAWEYSDPGLSASPQAWAVFGASFDQLDEWMLAFDQAAALTLMLGDQAHLRWHPHSTARAQELAAERAACRLWAQALELGRASRVSQLLTDETLYLSEWYGAPLVGRAAILAHLQSRLSALGVLPAALKGASRGQFRADCAMARHRSGGLEGACVRMFEGDARQPSALMIPMLQRGRVHVLNLCIPTNYEITSFDP
jgi:hypothetical protein